MEEITIGQILAANWVLITIGVVLGSGLVVWGVAARRRRHRRLPVTLGGVRIECQGAHLDEDLLVEQNWRITFLLMNPTHGPATLPMLSSRAVVSSDRQKFAGALYLERNVSELNPGEALIAWVVAQLPSEPSDVSIDVLRALGRPVTLASKIVSR